MLRKEERGNKTIEQILRWRCEDEHNYQMRLKNIICLQSPYKHGKCRRIGIVARLQEDRVERIRKVPYLE